MPIETIDKVETEVESATIENDFNGGLDGDFGTDEKSVATETADENVFGEGPTVDTAASDEAQTASDDDTGGYEASEVELRLAAQVGITADLVKDYANGADLADAIQSFQPKPSETQAPPVQQVPPQTTAEKPEGFKFESLDRLAQLKDETGEPKYETELVQGFRSDMERMKEHYDQRAEAAEQDVKSLRGDTAAFNETQRVQQFDTYIDGLGDEFKDRLGTGKTESLNKRSAQYQNRMKLGGHVLNLEAGYPEKSIPALTEMAMNIVFAADMQKTARKSVETKVKKRSRQVINAPTQTKTEGLSLNDEIEQMRKEFVRSKQISED